MELALVNNAFWGWSAAYNAIEKVLLQRGMPQRVYRDKDLVVQANKQRTEDRDRIPNLRLRTSVR